mmetsp:Transcript_14707/g.35990  ORF Transcript_14707/g.35990 Transcript_14707/m.35990 type:complete len:232 (-) Transcript_14707:154-849(-)
MEDGSGRSRCWSRACSRWACVRRRRDALEATPRCAPASHHLRRHRPPCFRLPSAPGGPPEGFEDTLASRPSPSPLFAPPCASPASSSPWHQSLHFPQMRPPSRPTGATSSCHQSTSRSPLPTRSGSASGPWSGLSSSPRASRSPRRMRRSSRSATTRMTHLAIPRCSSQVAHRPSFSFARVHTQVRAMSQTLPRLYNRNPISLCPRRSYQYGLSEYAKRNKQTKIRRSRIK